MLLQAAAKMTTSSTVITQFDFIKLSLDYSETENCEKKEIKLDKI